ncbi:MAG: polysaccharide biosynthesis C-terminal domain-containing protein [Bacteroidetes bacterium]|nr:polysaccharide biosynthesis C-terminal domain-containing protein [Bacteroidota bacterium]
MKGTIAKQSLWASAVNYSGSLIGLFTTFYLFPLVYTESQNGIIRLLVEFGALLAGVAQLGTGYSIWKFFPVFKNHEKRHNGAGFWLFIIPLLGFLLVAAALLGFQPAIAGYLSQKSSGFLPYYLWLLPFVFFFVYNSVFEIFLSSLGNIIYSSFLRENVVRVLMGLVGFLFYTRCFPFDVAVKLTPVIYALTAIVNLYLIFRATSISIRPDMAFVRNQPGLQGQFTRYTGYLFITYMANLFVQRMDFAMVTAMKGLSYTGVYSIALNLAVLVEIPTRSILQISNPRLAEAIHLKDMAEVRRLYDKTTLNQFILGALVLLVIWINIDVFYYFMPNGEKYAFGKYAVLLLGLGKLVILLQGNSSAMLTFSHRYYYSLFVNLGSVVAGIFLNQWLIPIWGLEGAAAATALTWLAAATITGILIYRLYGMNPYRRMVFITIGLFAALFLANAMVSWPGHFILTAVVKSLLLPGIALWVIYRFQLSTDIRSMIVKGLNRLGYRL